MHVSFVIKLNESITTWFAGVSVDDHMHLIEHTHTGTTNTNYK